MTKGNFTASVACLKQSNEECIQTVPTRAKAVSNPPAKEKKMRFAISLLMVLSVGMVSCEDEEESYSNVQIRVTCPNSTSRPVIQREGNTIQAVCPSPDEDDDSGDATFTWIRGEASLSPTTTQVSLRATCILDTNGQWTQVFEANSEDYGPEAEGIELTIPYGENDPVSFCFVTLLQNQETNELIPQGEGIYLFEGNVYTGITEVDGRFPSSWFIDLTHERRYNDLHNN